MGSNPGLSNRLRDYFPDLDSLLLAADDVRGLLAHPGWAHVARILHAEVDSIDEGLDGRALSDAAEYAFKHGRRGGLKATLEVADAIVQRADEEYARQRAIHEEPSNLGSARSAR